MGERAKGILVTDWKEDDLLMTLEVCSQCGERLGALVLRAVPNEETGKMDFKGVSLYTSSEIGKE